MQPILANYTASITELKKSPTQLLKDAGDEARSHTQSQCSQCLPHTQCFI